MGQQLQEAWPYSPAHRLLLFDHDSKFGIDVIWAVKDWEAKPSALPFAVRGRAASPSAGSGVADETCWTT